MDEPLSNLDAKLRIELREEIRDIQKQVDIATIYVTHDQEEALAISDRICVMSAGHIEQIGTPQQIYGDPQTRFVAEFVGTINLLAPGSAADALVATAGITGVERWAVRPERLTLGKPGEGQLQGTVSRYTYLGREAHVEVDTPAGRLVVQVANPGVTAATVVGDAVSLRLDPAALLAFDANGKRVRATR
jgi:iron(III) transport system ATP-binding protein